MIRAIALIAFLALVAWSLAGCATRGGVAVLVNPRCLIGCKATLVTQPVQSLVTAEEDLKANMDGNADEAP